MQLRKSSEQMGSNDVVGGGFSGYLSQQMCDFVEQVKKKKSEFVMKSQVEGSGAVLFGKDMV